MQQVIYAWNYLEWGGAQVHILALIKQARKEFSVAAVIPRDSDPRLVGYLDELGVRVEYFDGANPMTPPVGLKAKLSRRIIKAKSEYAMLKAIGRFDLADSIVHVDLLPHSSFAALRWLARRSHVFITSHNALPPVSRLRESLWKLRARAISRSPNFHVFCSNEHAKAYFSRHYSPQLADKIEVTYTSMNPEEIDRARDSEFDCERWRTELGIPTEAFVILTVGNFIDRKGRWTLLDAAAKLQSDGSIGDIYFVWLSPQLPEGEDNDRVEKYGLGNRFQVVRSDSAGTERIDVLKFFRIADAFALPSFVEGLPIALLEAMAIGLPSISTNVYAIPEAVKDAETGLLIEAGDSAALAAAVLRYRNDPAFRGQMARSGRDYVRRHFDEREVARRVVSAYKRALSQQS